MCADLFAGLNAWGKQQLIVVLTKDLAVASTDEKQSADAAFHLSFGAFASDKSPEALIAETKNSRVFRDKPLEF